jgi:hypothetical protein
MKKANLSKGKDAKPKGLKFFYYDSRLPYATDSVTIDSRINFLESFLFGNRGISITAPLNAFFVSMVF